MAAQKKRGRNQGPQVPPSRSMPSTTGAKPSGAHSYADSTYRRVARPVTLAAPSTPMIKPSRKGLFTAKAKAAGMGVQAYAAHVLGNKDKFPAATVAQANFAKNIGGAAKKGG